MTIIIIIMIVMIMIVRSEPGGLQWGQVSIEICRPDRGCTGESTFRRASFTYREDQSTQSTPSSLNA
jgi:hypothetical protein